MAVAEAPTWSAAATSVGVSPSALSQGLAELERRIGVELFEPVGRRRMLRASAQPVLDHARQVVGLTQDLAHWSQRLASARSGQVRLGLIDVAAVVHFPELLRAFRMERPDVELTITVSPSASLLDDLRAGRLDLAVCVQPTVPIVGLETTALLSEPLVVYAPPDTEIGTPSTWGPWVMFPAGSHTRDAVFARLAELGAELRVAAESHQPDVLVEMVALGIGWAVLPEPRHDVAHSGVIVGTEIMQRELVLARREASVHDPVADELAARLRSDAASRRT